MTQRGEQGGRVFEQFESPALAGLSPLARAQVINAINLRLIVELVELLGGEVVLPAGFSDRAAAAETMVGTRFEDDGSYRVWLQGVPPEMNHPGVGTRWSRLEGPRKRPERRVYDVIDVEAGYVVLQPITADGRPIEQAPAISVREGSLREGSGGWERWTPPDELVERLTGRTL